MASSSEELQESASKHQETASRSDYCLCLSGGGFRATLFHLGVIQRLNELGLLAQLATITSVSGGSILNGLLASRWSQLELSVDGTFGNLDSVVAQPMREFCSRDLRTKVLLGTRLRPWKWPALIRDRLSVSGNELAKAYEPLFGKRLGELPAPGPNSPRFVLCATNVATGACWHFHGGPAARMGDFYTGYCDAQGVRVSEAVAASSAFPPGFSALRLHGLQQSDFTRVDQWGETRATSAKRPPAEFQDVLLTDGGVYDNLGVEPVWNSYCPLLVSDVGRPFVSKEGTGQGIVSRLLRAADISMEQVGAVRKRWLVEQLTSGSRAGAMWALHSRLNDFPVTGKQGYGPEACLALQQVRTDLNSFSEAEISCLENHGYSMADAAVRSFARGACRQVDKQFAWPHEAWTGEQSVRAALVASGRRRLLLDATKYLFWPDCR